MDDLAKLQAAEYNPRRISGHDFTGLVDAIGKFGDMEGLVFNRRSGRIVGGHQRKEAYQKKGGHIEITETLDEPNEVGTVARGYVTIGTEKFSYRVVDWPEEKEKLANMATNRLQGEWDDDKLAELIYSIKDNPDLPDAGFTVQEVTQILAGIMDTGEDEDADLTPPEPNAVRTLLGDLYQLGDNRLLCGDATNAADVAALMGGAKAAMVFTDPPYNVDYKGSAGQEAAGKKRKGIANDKQRADDFYGFLFHVCQQLLQHTKGAFYICMSSSELHTLHRAFTENGGHWQTYIIWAKHHFVMGRRDYQSQFEPVLYGLSEDDAASFNDSDRQVDSLPILYGYNKHHWYGGRKQGDVWMIDRPTRSPDHPTEKPLALPARAIRNSSALGEIVLDVFGGSGSTLIAAHQLQRRCYMMELDPRYCDVIIRRWEHLTGQKAELVKNIREGSDGRQ